jgi:hypothetical protein
MTKKKPIQLTRFEFPVIPLPVIASHRREDILDRHADPSCQRCNGKTDNGITGNSKRVN